MRGSCVSSYSPAVSLHSWKRHVRLIPVLVRIEARNGCRALRSLWTKVALIDDSVLVDDKGHDAGDAIVHRPGNDAKAANHATTHEVIVRASGRRRALGI